MEETDGENKSRPGEEDDEAELEGLHPVFVYAVGTFVSTADYDTAYLNRVV